MDTFYNVAYYINYISRKISVAYDDSSLCQHYAWLILQEICKKTRTELIVQNVLMLSSEQKNKIEEWILRLVNEHEPLQYILGAVPFASCDILVEPPTLIPRPETEEWCLYIIEHLNILNDKKLSILDVATGSGCVAVALAHHFPQAEIVATDVADQALELAQKNGEHNKVNNIIYIHSDLFESIPLEMKFDLIISNPPYISLTEFNDLEKMVTEWEDYNALVAADNGLAIIKKIIINTPKFIRPHYEMRQKNVPQVGIEIGYTQADAVKLLMKDAGYNDILVHKDLEGKDRFVTGRVDYVANTCD